MSVFRKKFSVPWPLIRADLIIFFLDGIEWFIIINKTYWYDINKTRQGPCHSLAEYRVADRLMFIQNWWTFLYCSNLPLPSAAPPHLKGLERNRTVWMGGMQSNVPQIYLHPPCPLFPSTHCQTSGWGNDKGLCNPWKSFVTLSPSADSLSNTHVWLHWGSCQGTQLWLRSKCIQEEEWCFFKEGPK